MGWLQDLLQEVPLSAVLRERVALAEQKFDRAQEELDHYRKRVIALEKEIERLRAQLPAEQPKELSSDTRRVLIHLFKTTDLHTRDVGAMASELAFQQGVLQYHLDRLEEIGLAEISGLNYLHGHQYWALTPEGRQYVVERGLT